MGNGIYCEEGLTNDTITLISFSFEVSKHSFNLTGLTQPVIELLNKMCVNHDVKGQSSLALSVHASPEVASDF